jgi:hypothetical protein
MCENCFISPAWATADPADYPQILVKRQKLRKNTLSNGQWLIVPKNKQVVCEQKPKIERPNDKTEFLQYLYEFEIVYKDEAGNLQQKNITEGFLESIESFETEIKNLGLEMSKCAMAETQMSFLDKICKTAGHDSNFFSKLADELNLNNTCPKKDCKCTKNFKSNFNILESQIANNRFDLSFFKGTEQSLPNKIETQIRTIRGEEHLKSKP